jgi:hypothetical protein
VGIDRGIAGWDVLGTLSPKQQIIYNLSKIEFKRASFILEGYDKESEGIKLQGRGDKWSNSIGLRDYGLSKVFKCSLKIYLKICTSVR